jgi:hypothetical protein
MKKPDCRKSSSQPSKSPNRQLAKTELEAALGGGGGGATGGEAKPFHTIEL